jgi:GNAT superfamily N-acetyltransferase
MFLDGEGVLMADIRKVSYADILGAPNAKELFAEYESECANPELAPINPQADLYALMEASGGLQAFGVYEGDALIGFLTVLVWTIPHYGKNIGSNADIFLAPGHRMSGTGARMIDLAEEYAKSKGGACFQWTVPAGSRFARLLALNAGRYRRSNSVYLRTL